MIEAPPDDAAEALRLMKDVANGGAKIDLCCRWGAWVCIVKVRDEAEAVWREVAGAFGGTPCEAVRKCLALLPAKDDDEHAGQSC